MLYVGCTLCIHEITSCVSQVVYIQIYKYIYMYIHVHVLVCTVYISPNNEAEQVYTCMG